MRLTAHGGVGEIGGNKVLLESERGGLWLDFGYSFGQMKQFYCEFCQPRSWAFVGDQLALGLLPDLSGVYRNDMLSRLGREEPGPPAQQAVFVTHAHLDHVGMVPALRPDLPVHLSEPTHAVLETIDTSGQAIGSPDMFTAFTRKFKLVEAKRGGVKKAVGGEAREPRDVRTFAPGREVDVAEGLSVAPLAVDHSLPGASAFVVHADGRALVYTGDLRFHGRHAGRSERFLDAASSEDVDVLVTEGTRVAEQRGMGEQDVLDQVTELVSGCNGMVLANYPVRDLDRIVTFHEAAKAAGRDLVINTRQALLLDNLASLEDEPVPRLGDHLRVLATRQRWGVVGESGFPREIQAQDFEVWERPYAMGSHAVLDHDVREQQDRFVVFLNFFHLQALIDLRPSPGSIFIRSMVEPFDEDMVLDEERVRNWMRRFDLEVHQCHASGHASGPDISRLVEALAPRVVVPVHTERPEAFTPMHGDVRPPNLGVPMEL